MFLFAKQGSVDFLLINLTRSIYLFIFTFIIKHSVFSTKYGILFIKLFVNDHTSFANDSIFRFYTLYITFVVIYK